MLAQLDILSPRLSADEIAAGARRSGLLPTINEAAHLTTEEMAFVAQEWIQGSREQASVAAAEARRQFAARGWPFAWLLNSEHPQQEALDEAVDVVDRYYTKDLVDGAQLPESMGIAQHKGFGGCEGIQVKRTPYGSDWLVSVYCVTGPVNMVAGEGVEFEPGAKSHVFHLLYRHKLPEGDVLAGDIAAHPLITAEENIAKGAEYALWRSEGWLGKPENRPRAHLNWKRRVLATT